MNKERTIYHEVLALDSIYSLLTFSERILLHACIISEMDLNNKIQALIAWVKLSHWQSPKMKYPEFQKDVLHYEDPETCNLIAITEYPVRNLKITEQIKQLR